VAPYSAFWKALAYKFEVFSQPRFLC
jgi:hypothetical protein